MLRKLIYFLLITLIIGLLLPQNFTMPVEGASKADYNSESFWYYPWGKSVTHKGVDIFANEGTPVLSATKGWVIYAGNINMGGNVVLVLGPKWRFHYYAHLFDIQTTSFSWVQNETLLGSVGSTGNAAGKSPHLHYSISTLLPYFWLIDNDRQAWKKMFYLNPTPYLDAL
jgi:murein DD-endopeptidase MepM/ murein hydrolase activator NlpD